MRRLFTIAAVVLAAGSVIFARSGMQAPGQEPEPEKKLIDLKSDNMGPIAPGFDVEACNGDGQQTYRGEYGETAAYVIGDNERFVPFIVCSNACCAFLGICNGNDHLFGHLLAALVFALLFQQAEGQSRFGIWKY